MARETYGGHLRRESGSRSPHVVDRLRAEGDLDHAEAWQPIIKAIEELLRAGRGEGEAAPKGTTADGKGRGA